MSCFVKIKTKVKDIEVLKTTLNEMVKQKLIESFKIKEGEKFIIKDYSGRTQKVDILIRLNDGREIGLNKSGDSYFVVGDFYKSKWTKNSFTNKLNQLYSKNKILKEFRRNNITIPESHIVYDKEEDVYRIKVMVS